MTNSMGAPAQKLDVQSENTRPVGSTVAALHELVGAMRDNAYLPPWAVDALLGMQESSDDAQALLVALGAHGLVSAKEQ